jgi:hypothetical protein
MKFATRAYNQFSINEKTKSSIIKTSDEVRLKGEAEYYLYLPDQYKIYFPRVLSSSLTIPYSLELEYYAYSNLGLAMIEGRDEKFWDSVFDFLLNYLKFCAEGQTVDAVVDDFNNMLIEKTEIEYRRLFSNFSFFNAFNKEEEFYLNGKKLLAFNKIWAIIKEYINGLCPKKFVLFHGDLCFSNILYGINPITSDVILKFIDPRGVYGRTKYYGDQNYDYAKIFHSCHGGYEFFIYDQFDIETNDNAFDRTYKNVENKDWVFKKFCEVIDVDLLNIKVIEGCIFIGMCARHFDSLNRQKAMFITGLEILNEVYESL